MVALDISSVAAARARSGGVPVVIADAGGLPFRDRVFGTSCALDVLEHLADPLGTLREMARVAEDVVVVVPNFHYWQERMRMVLGLVPHQWAPHRGHVYWLNYQEVLRLCREAGLIVDRMLVGGFARLVRIRRRLAVQFPNLFAPNFAFRLRRM